MAKKHHFNVPLPKGINWAELGSILEGSMYHVYYLGRSASADPDRSWECSLKGRTNKLIRGYGQTIEAAIEVALSKLAAHVFASDIDREGGGY